MSSLTLVQITVQLSKESADPAMHVRCFSEAIIQRKFAGFSSVRAGMSCPDLQPAKLVNNQWEAGFRGLVDAAIEIFENIA